MKTCVFFGHRDTPPEIRPLLRKAIEDLILRHGVDNFYVGSHGHFDAYALAALRELAAKYPHIRYAVALAYLPQPSDPRYAPGETLLPEDVEKGPQRFAIDRRNAWMLRQADCVVAYVKAPGGAEKYVRKALRGGKPVRNLAQPLATPDPERL